MATSTSKIVSNNLEVPSWLDEDHFFDIIKDDICLFRKIVKFEVTSGTSGFGENFSSLVLKAKIKYECEDGSLGDISFFIKTIPEGAQDNMKTYMTTIFPKERTMYRKYLPEFEQIYSEIGNPVKFGPKYFIFTQDAGVEYIILEDLCSRSFRISDRVEGLDKKHVELVLELLAKLHAASAMRFATKGDYEESFMKPRHTESSRELLQSWIGTTKVILFESLSKSTICQKYLSLLSEVLEDITDVFILLGCNDPDDFNVIRHGDLWVNNILFRYKERDQLAETIFIDFQASSYCSFSLDLFYFLLSSTHLDLKASHFDYFIEYYHDSLVKNLMLLKYSKKIPTLKGLHDELLKYKAWAISTLITILPLVLLDPNKNIELDTIYKDKENGNSFVKLLLNNPRYIQHMEIILPWLKAKGFLSL